MKSPVVFATTLLVNYATKEEGDGLWDDSNRLVVLCAALLHDVGHGPYSHTFEKIFDTNHEQITIDIILSEETEVNQILRKVSSTFPQEVASVIQKTHPNPQVVQLISSQIDADRMDYLLRDAYFTGVNYGTFDLTRILRVIRPYKGGICIYVFWNARGGRLHREPLSNVHASVFPPVSRGYGSRC